MRLAHDAPENKGMNRNNESVEKTEKKEGKLKKFCSYLWDTTKASTRILAVAIGMTAIAYGCGGKPRNSGDADTDQIEIIDGENDADIDEVGDVPEDEEVEGNCLPQGTILEGEVDPFIANTENNEATLNSSDSEVSGDTMTTVGGEVSSSDMLILGECPDDPDAIAAFGAQDGTIDVTPQYRLDFGSTVFVFQLPSVSEDTCPPIDSDNIPVSMYNEDVNLSTKNVLVGTIRTRGEVGFTATFAPSLMVNGSESASPVILDGSGYDVKAIMVSLENPLLEMAAAVYSNRDEEILSKEVQGAAGSVDSKKLNAYQLGEGDSMLPEIVWNDASGTMCMRPQHDASEVTHEEKIIDAVVTPKVVDACGRIFDGFNLESLTVVIEPGHFNPPDLAPLYSFDITEMAGVDTMGDGSPTITLTVTREPPNPSEGEFDMGERVEVILNVQGEIVSRDINPKTGERDRVVFDIQIELDDPDANIQYLSECGYEPAGF